MTMTNPDDSRKEETMSDGGDTPETRGAARVRGHRLRRSVYPSEKAQIRYPVADFPCGRCAKEGLPHLVDNGSEFYWEHHPEGSGRSGCPRFGNASRHDDYGFGLWPRAGSATSLFRAGLGGNAPRSEDDYLAAQKKVEEDGADDYFERRKR